MFLFNKRPLTEVRKTIGRCILTKSHLLHIPPCPALDISRTCLDWKEIYEEQRPLVLKGLATSWVAYQAWQNIDYLIDKYGHVEVTVEVGGDYMSEKTKFITVPFAKALKKLRSIDEQKSLRKGFGFGIHYYVSQLPLHTFPGIMDDIEIPDICAVSSKGGVQRSALWVGSANTSSPCHFDPFHNVLVQINGSKSVCLFHPDMTSKLFPCSPPQSNTSSILFNNFDFNKNENEENGISMSLQKKAGQKNDFECFLQSPIPPDKSYYAELNSGDAIFIPIKWWHFCKARSHNSSVNFWWL